MVGIDAASDGLARAREQGLSTTAEGVDGLLPHLERDGIRIAFDATSAYVHPENARKLAAARGGGDRSHAGGDRPVLRAAGEPRRARGQGRDERQHGQLRRPGDHPDRGGRGAGAAGQLRGDRRHGGLALRRPGHAQEHRRVHAHHRERHREGRRRQARQGHHHPQSRRAAAHHARHGALPDRGGPGRGSASAPRSRR